MSRILSLAPLCFLRGESRKTNLPRLKNVPSPFVDSLTCPYANVNMTSKYVGYKRQAPPFAPRADYQFITSPLLRFNIIDLQSSVFGREYFGRGITAEHVVVVAGCDERAAEYLSSSPRVIIVYECGEVMPTLQSSKKLNLSSGASASNLGMSDRF